ncbi:2-C-methyl-D-erythritol 4-phosphate cytidylyltransferase, partial [Brevundimonas sp.]|uniref:2-C-methyl-D-erythritol 4-phosphate cytidylyltransferase n=2 Tax=Brevundimonas TaxID=41275 RepID=UPI0028B02FED
MGFAAIVVAAGSGSRAGGDKQWRSVGAKPMVRWSVETLLKAGADPVLVVVAPGAESRLNEALDGLSGWTAVIGGATRAESVCAGLT